MAIFQVSKQKKGDKVQKNIKKIVGIVLLAVASVCFLFSITSLWPAFQYFLRGVFGVFIYPLSVLCMILGLALMNNKKYVMSKRYAIFLSLSIIFLLAIIQLIIVGNAYGADGKELNFGQYLVLSYTKQFSAGGILIGLLTTPLVVWLNLPAAYIILSLALLISGAFFAEAIINARKNAEVSSPVKIQIKERRVPKTKEMALKTPKEEINVVLNGQIQENLSKEQIAKQKLGLLGTTSLGPNTVATNNQPRQFKVQDDEPAEKIPQGMSIKEYLLSPPKVDMEKYMHNRAPAAKREAPRASQTEMNQTIRQMKQENLVQPSQYLHEEIYNVSNKPAIKRGNLPEVRPEELVSEADDIIRSVVQQELSEMQEESITPNATISPLNEPMHRDLQMRDDYHPGLRADAAITGDRMESPSGNFGRDFMRGERADLSRTDGNNSADITGAEFRKDHMNDRMDLRRTNESDFTRERMTDRNEPKTDRERRFVSLDGNDAKGNTGNPKSQSVRPYKYNKPPIDLIHTQSDDLSLLNDEVPAKRVALENALEKFGVPAKVQSVVIGPTVTRYEIAMPEGISVKKILSLDADIAYALSARGEIRIEAPIPGRSIVGIEVPNDKVAKVSIKDVLQSKEFTMSPSPLAFSLGKDITGTVRVCNLQKMPHLLVAGTTGSGKSVCLNAIIVSILYKASPDDVKFIMIDPKQVELSMYEGLPHMVVPKVITDPVKTVNALQWAVDEMEKRFNLISEARVRNIDEYNRCDEVVTGRKKKMPYLVIIFDEFADFMLVAKNEIEDKIRRLAQKARAAGIHLILATQRPSTDVVTGTIKANFPARIAFRVAGRVDSEVILGSTGAEKLLGYGDMLYKPSDSAPARMQGCFIDTPETKDIVNYIIQNNEEVYDEEANNAINCPGKSSGGSEGVDSSMDPLLPQALKICIDVGVASTTMVQRKLSIGYPRAARIIDQMEERGYISSAEGSKQRSVYISIEEFYQIFGDTYD